MAWISFNLFLSPICFLSNASLKHTNQVNRALRDKQDEIDNFYEIKNAIYVYVIVWFWVQFVKNLREWGFSKTIQILQVWRTSTIWIQSLTKSPRVCFSRLHEKTYYYTVLASDEPGGKRNRTLICTITYRTLYLLYCTKRNVIVHYIYYTVLSNIHEKNICRIRVTHARNTCERSLFAHLNNTTIQSKFW